MAWSLVCPASRGIGFQLTRHLLQNTKLDVVSTARSDIAGVKKNILDGLNDVDPKRLNVLELDVTDEATIEAAATRASSLFPSSSYHLRLAFIMPGILYPEKSPSALSHDQLTETFATNTIGPLLLTKHFTPFLPKKSTPISSIPGTSDHAIWLTMSARVGSTSDNQLGGWYSYRASKAGVNSITKSLDLYLRTRCGEKAIAIAYHPGTVKTGLSKEFWSGVKEGKLFSPEFAVEKMVSVVGSVGLEGRGKCWDWDGKEIEP